MIDKLVLAHFKAFKEPAEMVLDGKDVLIFGENGAGKSSLYQALKVIFHRKKIFDAEIDITTDALGRPNAEADVLRQYNYQKESDTDFTLDINGTDYKAFTPANCDVSMISREDIFADDKINVVNLFGKSIVGISDPEKFVSEKKKTIEQLVNSFLKEYFYEDKLTVELIYSRPDWFLKIKDSGRLSEGRSEDLTGYFNEAKLHTIKLLLLLTAILYNGAAERGDKRVLVLDDVISSMDAANRTFFVQLIKEYFGEYQKIILTHSISFFNMAVYAFTIIYGQKDDWRLFHVVERDGNSVIEARDAQDYAASINFDFTKRHHPIAEVGNRIRKRFEFLVGEVSRLLCVGGLVESGTLIEAINTSKKLYYAYDPASSPKNKTIYDMVDELVAIIDADSGSPLKTQLQTVIGRYVTNTEVERLRETICDLAVYQKVSMHPLSHSTAALPIFTAAEVSRSITLLMTLEKQLGALIGRDYYSM